jgi:choline kinase
MQLVIIAAGQGSRLRSVTAGQPKSLLPVNGRAVIDHLLDNARSLDLSGVIVVTGYEAGQIEDHLAGYHHDGLPIRTVHNPDWKEPNGISVLAARSLVPESAGFLVSMSDHLYGPALLKKIAKAPMDRFTARVGLDFDLDSIYDMDDAMKVTVAPDDRDVITGMSKELTAFDAVDCGLFICRHEFFDTLAEAVARGKGSLSGACNLLMPDNRLGGIDIGTAGWLDIDTPEAYAELDKPEVLNRILPA